MWVRPNLQACHQWPTCKIQLGIRFGFWINIRSGIWILIRICIQINIWIWIWILPCVTGGPQGRIRYRIRIGTLIRVQTRTHIRIQIAICSGSPVSHWPNVVLIWIWIGGEFANGSPVIVFRNLIAIKHNVGASFRFGTRGVKRTMIIHTFMIRNIL